MNVTDPSAIVGSIMVFTLGVWTHRAGVLAKREEGLKQGLKDSVADKLAREDVMRQAALETAQAKDRETVAQAARASSYQKDAEFWRNRGIDIQERLDNLQALHDHLLAEWVELGTSRAEQLEIVRVAYRKTHPQTEVATES